MKIVERFIQDYRPHARCAREARSAAYAHNARRTSVLFDICATEWLSLSSIRNTPTCSARGSAAMAVVHLLFRELLLAFHSGGVPSPAFRVFNARTGMNTPARAGARVPRRQCAFCASAAAHEGRYPGGVMR